jgi:hypothetical protein
MAILLTWATGPVCGIILARERTLGKRAAQRRLEGWFETPRFARLLTMRGE